MLIFFFFFFEHVYTYILTLAMILCDNVNVDFMYITFTLNIYNVSEVNQHWLNRILVF